MEVLFSFELLRFCSYDPGLIIWWKIPSLGAVCTGLKGKCFFDLFYSKVLLLRWVLIHMRNDCGLLMGLPLGKNIKWIIVAVYLFAFSGLWDVLHKHFLFLCTVLSYILSGLLDILSQKPFITSYCLIILLLTFVQLSTFVVDPCMSLTSTLNMTLYLSAWLPLNSTCDLTLLLIQAQYLQVQFCCTNFLVPAPFSCPSRPRLHQQWCLDKNCARGHPHHLESQ